MSTAPRGTADAAARPGKPDYYLLLGAQALALVSTGVATVALALLAYRLAGADSGGVLGTALAIKMLTYVSVAPLGTAIAERLPRRSLLIALDLVRAGVVFLLPLVTEVWQIYLLIFVFQAASGIFTPTVQALVTELVPGEKDYAKALARSRLMLELDGAISPALAAGLLLLMSFAGLFGTAVLGFLVSAALILRTVLPPPVRHGARGPISRIRRGLGIFLATPRLRALMALNLAVAVPAAMVTVNTVVLVRADLGLPGREAAVALAVFGLGSVLGALAVPRLLDARSHRAVMLGGSALAAGGLALGALVPGYAGLLGLWALIGFGGGVAATPAGMLLRRSSARDDRPALYAAQFALANAALLLGYLLAGWLGAWIGMPAAFLAMGALAALAVAAAAMAWPRRDMGALAEAEEDARPDAELPRGDHS